MPARSCSSPSEEVHTWGMISYTINASCSKGIASIARVLDLCSCRVLSDHQAQYGINVGVQYCPSAHYKNSSK